MNSKSKYFQSIRGVCILAVILIHSLQFSDNIMANYLFIGIRSCINFCVAVFIFMAGYFTNINKFDNDKKGFYKTKFKRLVIPLLLWNLIYVSIKLICGKYENIYSLIKSLFSFSSSAQLYYILVLIQLFILLPLIIKMLNNKRTKWILYTITPLYNIILMVINFKLKIMIPFYQYFIFGWLLYFVLGIEYRKNENIINQTNRCLLVVLCMVVSVILNIILYKNNIFTYNMLISQINILSCLLSINIIKYVMYLNSKTKSNKQTILSNIGDESYGMYYNHMLILLITRKITEMFTSNLYINILSTYLTTVLISYLIIKILKKFINNKNLKYIGF